MSIGTPAKCAGICALVCGAGVAPPSKITWLAAIHGIGRSGHLIARTDVQRDSSEVESAHRAATEKSRQSCFELKLELGRSVGDARDATLAIALLPPDKKSTAHKRGAFVIAVNGIAYCRGM
jgi:hypothetical protein